MRHVYGPIRSARLGRSLGIDLFGGVKTCNFDCSYCQLGPTRRGEDAPIRLADADAVVEEARRAADGVELDWITVSGAGEPTLHPGLGEVIEGIRRTTGRRVAVVTNGSRLGLPEVRAALADADAVLPTLAAAEIGAHWLLHRPRARFAFRRHVEGLLRFRRTYRGLFWLEVMLVRGVNDQPEQIDALARLVRRLRPDAVHVTRPTRPGTEPWAQEPSFRSLLHAVRVLGGVVPQPMAEEPVAPETWDGERVLESIERAARCHPLREEDALLRLRSAGVMDPAGALERLLSRRTVRRRSAPRGKFIGPA